MPASGLHPAWQGAGAAGGDVHTSQTNFVPGNPATLASRAPSVLSAHHGPGAGWNAQETYVGQTQWQQEPPPLDQDPRLLAIQDVAQGPGAASTEGGTDSSGWRDNALLARRS